MRLKSFQAESMKEAMALVRANLGEDAIIVSTREDRAENIVRVTAAIEEFDAEEPALDFGEDDWDYGEETSEEALSSFYSEEDRLFENYADEDFISDRPERSITLDHEDILGDEEEDYFESAFAINDHYDDDEEIDFFNWEIEEDEEGDLVEQGFIEPITESLIRHNVPANITDKIISSAIASEYEATKPALMTALDAVFHFKPLPEGRHTKPIILVGPPGGGKTLCTAKIATRAVMDGLNTAVISTDTVRAGGVDQLRAFTKLLDIDLMTASDPHALEDCIAMHNKADQIIIDTPGISPFRPEDMRELANLLKVTDFETILVLPAGSDAQECADMARAFEILGIKSLLPTKLDISRRYGGILTAAYHGRLSLTDGSSTPSVADGLHPLDANSLSKLLIPSLYKENQSG